MKNKVELSQRPLITVILPCYNVGRYIEKSLSSILNQTIKNIEVICINDGSTDDTLDILNCYSINDERVKIYNQKNQGQGIARNNGIKHANGEYIAFVDPDDWIEYNMYENLYRLAVQSDVDFIECGLNKYYETSGELKKVKFDYPACENKIFNYKNDLNYVFKGTSLSPCNKLFKKSFIIDNDIYFSNRRLSEDQIFTLKAKVKAKKIIYIPKNYYNYRIRPQSSLTTKKRENLHFENIVSEIKDFFKSQELYNDFKDYIDEATINIVREHYTLCPDYLKNKFLINAKKNLDSNLFNIFNNNREIHNKNSFLENIFSLKNENKFGIKYKRITFLGLKWQFAVKR